MIFSPRRRKKEKKTEKEKLKFSTAAPNNFGVCVSFVDLLLSLFFPFDFWVVSPSFFDVSICFYHSFSLLWLRFFLLFLFGTWWLPVLETFESVSTLDSCAPTRPLWKWKSLDKKQQQNLKIFFFFFLSFLFAFFSRAGITISFLYADAEKKRRKINIISSSSSSSSGNCVCVCARSRFCLRRHHSCVNSLVRDDRGGGETRRKNKRLSLFLL